MHNNFYIPKNRGKSKFIFLLKDNSIQHFITSYLLSFCFNEILDILNKSFQLTWYIIERNYNFWSSNIVNNPTAHSHDSQGPELDYFSPLLILPSFFLSFLYSLLCIFSHSISELISAPFRCVVLPLWFSFACSRQLFNTCFSSLQHQLLCFLWLPAS